MARRPSPPPAPDRASGPPRVGITGHCNLTEATAALVLRELRRTLAGARPGALVGVSCLARGADQLFAQVVLELGGALEVILPARDYRTRKVAPDNAAEFDRLLIAATTVTIIEFDRSCRQAYMAASDAMLTSVHTVLAVWDGQPSIVHADTADVVTEARHRRLPVTVIWPPGAARTITVGSLTAAPASITVR